MDTQMINFTIPTELLRKVDLVAKQEDRNRSELLREAARRYLEQQKIRQLIFPDISDSAKKVGLSENKAMELAETAKKWARNT